MKKLTVVALSALVAALVVAPLAPANAASDHATVKGTITTESGSPVKKADVTVGIGDCETPGGCGADSVVNVTTNSDGRFSARVLVTSNPNVRVSVAKIAGLLPRTSANIRIASGKTYSKNLTLFQRSKIGGKIIDQSGAPITAVVDAYDAESGALAAGDVAQAKSGGLFILTLRGGAYKLKFYYDTTPGQAGGVVTSWLGGKTKGEAKVVKVKPGTNKRVVGVFTP